MLFFFFSSGRSIKRRTIPLANPSSDWWNLYPGPSSDQTWSQSCPTQRWNPWNEYQRPSAWGQCGGECGWPRRRRRRGEIQEQSSRGIVISPPAKKLSKSFQKGACRLVEQESGSTFKPTIYIILSDFFPHSKRQPSMTKAKT